jgi:hypothetical protein
VRKFYTARWAASRTNLGFMSHREPVLRPTFVLITAFAAASLVGGCGSSSQPAPGPPSTAFAVSGPADTHCIANGVETKQAVGMCLVDDGSAAAAPPPDAGGAEAADGGGSDDGGAMTSEYGDTLYNAEGDDDDCKYHVSWTSTAVKENGGVFFDVNVLRLADGQPATGANVQPEVFLTNIHPTPSTDIPNTESAGGNYKVGPVVFDAPGKWTVRFHFYEMCSDAPEDSPHGHAAFYVHVP